MKIVQLGGMILPLVLCAAMQASAATTVIDFEELTNSAELLIVGESYSHYVSADQTEYYLIQAPTPTLSVYGAQAEYGYTGSAALMNDSQFGFSTLTYTNDTVVSLFSISSIDVSEISQYSAYEDSVTFFGIKEGGALIQQMFTIDGQFGNQTFVFNSDFTDLEGLYWSNPVYSMQLDNIRVTSSPVPVPSSILLFGTVLTALAATGKRRKQS